MVGSAFGPTNPFQAGIAMKLAQVSPADGGGLRLATFVASFVIWTAWTMRYAARHRVTAADTGAEDTAGATGRDIVIFLLVLLPMAFYVYGSLNWGWGFNELSAGFFLATLLVGLLGGLGLSGTANAYLEGMQSLLSAALLVGVARAITVVLADGHVIDTILNSLAAPLANASTAVAALLMIPVHVIIHVFVSSVSGHAVLTMPVLVPLSDLLGISRQVTVLAYQTGAGLCDAITPTNGALMAILLAAGVSYERWFRFAVGGLLLAALVGVGAMLAAL
jgi:uncharacterized ion transporter superfamily protein YfcC